MAAERNPQAGRDLRGIALVGCLLGLAFVLRIACAHAHWTWFDTVFPATWEKSKIELSQDGTEYLLQAHPNTWNAELHSGWADRAYFRPPLASYYFVGLFNLTGFDRLAASSVQSLVAVCGYLLVYLLAEKLLNRRVALVTLVVLGLHPLLLFEDTSFEDSCLGMLFVALTLYTAWRARNGPPRRWVVPGIAMGCAALSRPNLLLIGAGIAILLWRWTAPANRRVALRSFAIPAVAFVLAATLHNAGASKRWSVITDMAGQNLYWGNNPFPDHRLSVQGFWDIREVDINNPSQLLANGLKQRTGVESTDAAFLGGAMEFIKTEPMRALAEIGRKAWRFLSNYEIPRNRDFGWCRLDNRLLQLPLLPFSVLLGFALLGARRLPRDVAFFLLLPGIATLVTEVVFFNASRYRALAIPFLAPLAVSGAFEVCRYVYAREWLRALPAAALVVGLFLAGAYAVPDSERTGHHAVAMYKAAMLESYADDDGNWAWLSLDRFKQRLAEARRLDPNNLDAFFIEQKYLIHEGEFETAEREIRARFERCRPGEWLCEDVCRSLRRLYSDDGPWTSVVEPESMHGG